MQLGESMRVVEATLGGDLRFIDPASDLRAVGRDSILLRIFRGAGIVCNVTSGAVVVRYRGLRAAEPDKDSVLVLDGIGWGRAERLHESNTAGDGCEPYDGERLYRWRLDDAPPTGSLLLIFETGAYHLSGDAFRYRRGDSGRQPLTAELIDVSRSAYRLAAIDGTPTAQAAQAAFLEVELAVNPDPAAIDRSPRPPAPVHLRHSILNGGRSPALVEVEP